MQKKTFKIIEVPAAKTPGGGSLCSVMKNKIANTLLVIVVVKTDGQSVKI